MEQDFNPEFISRMICRIDWPVFVAAAESVSKNFQKLFYELINQLLINPVLFYDYSTHILVY